MESFFRRYFLPTREPYSIQIYTKRKWVGPLDGLWSSDDFRPDTTVTTWRYVISLGKYSDEYDYFSLVHSGLVP